jgi:hypothetical protein
VHLEKKLLGISLCADVFRPPYSNFKKRLGQREKNDFSVGILLVMKMPKYN